MAWLPGRGVRLAVPALERLGDDLMTARQLALRAGRGAHRAAVDALRRRRQVVLRRARLSEPCIAEHGRSTHQEDAAHIVSEAQVVSQSGCGAIIAP